MRNRRRRNNEEENPDRWVVSYADFITLMFAFFTILYATSQQDADKAKSFEESVKKYMLKFNVYNVGDSGKDSSELKVPGRIDPPLSMRPKGNKDSQGLRYKVETFLEEQMSEGELEKVVQEITDDVGGVRISVVADEIFGPDSDKFTRQGQSRLDKLAKLILGTKRRVIIEGHADDGPLQSNRFPSSWDLASTRATRVARYLTKVHAYDDKRVAVMSFGASRPIMPSDSKKNRRRNRRIDFLIVSDDFPL